MATTKIILITSLFLLFIGCTNNQNKDVNTGADGIIRFNDSIRIDNNLLKSSLEYIKRNNLTNSNIEVSIDKREYNQIYITYINRGMADFEVRKFKPLFSYTINKNLFFVYTGAEELLSIPFNESDFVNRRQNKYDTVIKTWYVIEDNIIHRDDSCKYEEPFSTLQFSPPPIK